MGVDPILQVRFFTVGRVGGGAGGLRWACVHVYMFPISVPVLLCQRVSGVAATITYVLVGLFLCRATSLPAPPSLIPCRFLSTGYP